MTCENSLFWKWFNAVISKITERDYKFNPKATMGGENGTSYFAIKQVFGLDFMTSNVVSFQMHYMHDVSKASFRIRVSFKDELKNICHEMCIIATLAQYNE